MPLPTPAPSSPGGYDNDDEPQGGEQEVIIEAPENTGTYPEFGALCALLDRLQKERRQEMRRTLLQKWFALWRDRVGPDLYPLLRLLLPQKDRERAVYNIKEKTLAKAFIKALGLDPKAPDSMRLMNWKKPTDKDKTAGDFPTVLWEVVSKRSSVMRGTMRVDQVNACLDDLAACAGKLDKIMHAVRRISDATTPSEQRWIVRIILKDLIISVKETTILSVFHPDALSLFNTCSDLKRVAHQLWDENFRLNDQDKSVQLFRCFAPMLCKRPTKSLEETVALMKGAKFVIEEKLDGERIQIHKRGNEYLYYSRKGKDYTYLYGKTVSSDKASLTPYLHKAFRADVRDCILDGEMLVWDPVSEKLLPFGHLKTAALGNAREALNPRPCFKIFDILYVNGKSLLDRKLWQRKKLAHDIIKENKGRVEFSFQEEGYTAKDIRDALQKVMEERGEGLVIKHPDSQYQLNGRVSDWIKVKPEYMDDMGETVDVLVVGGNYGSGKRGGGVSTMICAVIEDRDHDDEETKYSTFVRIGSGFSYGDYLAIRAKPWKPWDKKRPPSWLITAPNSQDDKGDVYLEPEDSFVVKVKAAEITKTDQYGLKLTMRFPRAVRIRDDLDWTQCMTASDILEMTASTTKKKRGVGEDEEGPKKKRKTAKKPTALSQAFKGADTTDILVTSNIFAGMKFHVLDNPRVVDEKKTIETLIKQHGGAFCQKPLAREVATVFRVFGGSDQKPPLRVANIINEDSSDILRPSYINDCVERGERLPLSKKYFFYRAGGKSRTEEEEAEYQQDDEEEPAANDAMEASTSAALRDSADSVKRESAEPELDPSLSQYSEWVSVSDGEKARQTKHTNEPADESETEDESSWEAADDGEQTDEWEMLSSSKLAESVNLGNREATLEGDDVQFTPTVKQAAILPVAEKVTVKMGEDDSAMEYDPDIIFKHLRFYLDTPANARRNDMDVNSAVEAQITEDMAEISKLIEDNGGKIVDLADPKLTHIIVDKRDYSRLRELRKRTSKPKQRQLVQSDFIRVAVEAETLPDEDGFRP